MTVATSEYGMQYNSRNTQVIARAQVVSDDKWETVPIQTLPAGTPLNAHFETVERRHVDRVAEGEVPPRENYPIRLWRDGGGELYVVDGHVRAAIYYTLRKPMSVRIMDEQSLAELGDDEDEEV